MALLTNGDEGTSLQLLTGPPEVPVARERNRIRATRRGVRGPLLRASDLIAVAAAFAATAPFVDRGFSTVAFGFPADREATGPLDPSALLFAVVAVVGLILVEDRDRGLARRLALLVRLAAVSAISAWLTVLAGEAAGWNLDLRQLMVVSLVLPGLWLTGRVAVDLGRGRERVVLIGSGRVARQVTQLSLRHPESRVDVVGWLDDEPAGLDDIGSTHLGSISDLPALLEAGGIDRVVVCFSRARDERLTEVIRECDAHRVEIDMVPRMYELLPPSVRGPSLGGLPLVSLTSPRHGDGQTAAKRAFDLVVATALILLTLPVMGLIALAVALSSRGPVFYRSTRLGRGGVPFRMLKFRTMVVGADAGGPLAGHDLVSGELKAVHDPRVTRVGRVLRRLSMDELPQLFNVFAGTMSMVGPRPVLKSEAHGIEGWAARRHSVRPGITGLWQVLGRSTIPWAERMQLDYSYARNWSIVSDLSILASTVSALTSRRGAF